MASDGREGGFIVIHRKVRSSRLYRSLTGEQKAVFYEVLLAANWKDDGIVHAGKWVEIRRGEFAHSMETIAERADVSVKVVRTTYAKMMADDSHLPNGRGPFMVDRWTGGEPGRGLRILTVVNYDEYQRIDDEAGMAPGAPEGEVGARSGHDAGTVGARQGHQENQKNQINHGNQDDLRPARAARLGPAHPAFEAVTHWTNEVWPRTSTAACPVVETRHAQSLAGLCSRHTPAVVMAAMDRMAADPFWAKQMDLDSFISKIGRFLHDTAPPAKQQVTAAASERSAFKKGEVVL